MKASGISRGNSRRWQVEKLARDKRGIILAQLREAEVEVPPSQLVELQEAHANAASSMSSREAFMMIKMAVRNAREL